MNQNSSKVGKRTSMVHKKAKIGGFIKNHTIMFPFFLNLDSLASWLANYHKTRKKTSRIEQIKLLNI